MKIGYLIIPIILSILSIASYGLKHFFIEGGLASVILFSLFIICVIFEDNTESSSISNINKESESKPEKQSLMGVPFKGKNSMLCPKCQSRLQRKCNNCGLYSCARCFGTRCPICGNGILLQS